MPKTPSYRFTPLITVLNDGALHTLTELGEKLNLDPAPLETELALFARHFPQRLSRRGDKVRLSPPLAIFAAENFVGKKLPFTLEVRDTSLSTNDLLLARLKKGEKVHRLLLLTNEQLQGRGRGNHRWQSEVGDSILFSLGWQEQNLAEKMMPLPLVIAVSIARRLRELNLPAELKWPNDLVVGERKLGGILVERSLPAPGQALVIGVGLNYYLSPKALRQSAGKFISLWELQLRLAPRVLVEKLASAIISGLEEFTQDGFAPFQTDFNRWHRDHHRRVELTTAAGKTLVGVINKVSADGRLELVDEEGERHFILSAAYSLTHLA